VSAFTDAAPTLEKPAPLSSVGALEPALFEGVFLGGFECSSQQREDGRRLDLLASTQHDVFADADYARLREVGMTACRDGVSWVKSEPRPGVFDFSTVIPRIIAAQERGLRVSWDLMHFGWPDGLDVFSAEFPERLARYAAAFARMHAEECGAPPMITPVNEMSYLAWAGGDVRCMNPFEAARGVELKAQLVRGTIGAIDAIRAICPKARFLQPEPVIQIVPAKEHPKTWRRVESDNLLQYQTWDMLAGDVWPSLGGHPRYLDLIGVNFYPDNQFMLDGTTIFRGDERYRPFSEMLLEVARRYRRPMIVSETGAEGAERQPWLRYVCQEAERAMEQGCPLHGITLYPVVNHPGWADHRHCHNGLWDYADALGEREVCEPLLAEVRYQTPRLLAARQAMLERQALPAKAEA
jgi:hypothetical protein